MSYQCKVCAYPQMPHPPNDYNICPCCGVEYGLDDAFESHAELRDEWLLAGGPWFSEVNPFLRPANWDAWSQLDLADFPYTVRRPDTNVKINLLSPALPEGFHLINIIRQMSDWAQS